MKIQLGLLVALALIVVCSGKKYGKCELAKELVRHGISRSSLPDWICLIQAESSFNTATVGGPNKNGSKDWGLFQINDRYWCKDGKRAGDCNLNCRSLVDNSIADDVRCAKKILKRHGFNAWYGWINRCKGKSLPSVNDCF